VAAASGQQDRGSESGQEVEAHAEAKSGKKLCVLRTDRGGEFTLVEFVVYYADQGVVRHHTMPYSPQQNGVVER